jgi:hypothetical protein
MQAAATKRTAPLIDASGRDHSAAAVPASCLVRFTKLSSSPLPLRRRRPALVRSPRGEGFQNDEMWADGEPFPEEGDAAGLPEAPAKPPGRRAGAVAERRGDAAIRMQPHRARLRGQVEVADLGLDPQVAVDEHEPTASWLMRSLNEVDHPPRQPRHSLPGTQGGSLSPVDFERAQAAPMRAAA